MITGYLYCGRETVQYRNILHLIATVLFYCVCITMVFAAVGFFNSSQSIIFSLLPMLDDYYWYFTCYVLLFVLTPYLNIMINHLDRVQFRNLLVLLLLLTSILPTCFQVDFFRMKFGYSSAWLVVCYCIGAYIKRECCSCSPAKCMWIAVGVAAAVFAFSKGGANDAVFSGLTAYTSISVVVMSAMFVMLFSSKPHLGAGCWEGWNSLAKASFDVYILHSHIMVYQNIITGRFRAIHEVSTMYAVIFFLLVLATIYCLGWITYHIRSVLFRLARLDRLLEISGQWIDQKLFEEDIK